MKIKWIEELATEVYAKLGSGYSEAIYQNAMEIGIMDTGKRFDKQRDVAVMFRGRFVGRGIIDLFVDEVVIELKATPSKIASPERQQIRNYMERLDVKQGMIINFGQPSRSEKAISALEIEYIN